MADTCAQLSSEIAALRAEIARIPRVDEARIVRTTRSALQPDITTAVAGGVVLTIQKLDPSIKSAYNKAIDAIRRVDMSDGLARQAKSTADGVAEKIPPTQRLSAEAKAAADKAARDAYSSLSELEKEVRERHYGDNMLGSKIDTSDAKLQAELRNAISDVAYKRELQPIMAEANAARAEAAAKATKSEVEGVRGLVSNVKQDVAALSESVGSRFRAFEGALGRISSTVGEALAKAGEAIGISRSAQAVAGEALGKIFALASKIAEIFVIIAAIQEIIAQLKTLEILGERIDAIEREVIAVGASVSQILGKLLGLQNRIANNEVTIGEVRGIASNALSIGNAASALATRAVGIATEAKNEAASALVRAAEAVATTAAVLALFRGIKVLRGEPGIKGTPGINGRNGVDGKNGVSIPGINGRNGLDGAPGITTVVQIPGTPGKDGVPGQNGRPGVGFPGKNGISGKNGTNGINGKNGVDAVPYNDAGLKALIIQQHAATRTNINATSSGLVGGIKAFFTTQLAGITALITLIAKNTYVEKALAVLTFATTLHNAVVLSSNLGVTLASIIDSIVGLILPKGLDGTPIVLTDVLGKAVHQIIEETVGKTISTAAIEEKWNQANRIYQAALNIHNQVLGLGGVLTAGMEVIGGNVGKIGNALRKGGVLLEDAYQWMNPQPNLKGKFFQQMNLVGEKAQAIALVVAIPIALAECKNGVDSSVADLHREIAQIDPKKESGEPERRPDGSIIHYEPGLKPPLPVVEAAKNDQAKADSTNFLELVLEDIFDGGD